MVSENLLSPSSGFLLRFPGPLRSQLAGLTLTASESLLKQFHSLHTVLPVLSELTIFVTFISIYLSFEIPHILRK
jgi:hypothetical protein